MIFCELVLAKEENFINQSPFKIGIFDQALKLQYNTLPAALIKTKTAALIKTKTYFFISLTIKESIKDLISDFEGHFSQPKIS